MKLLRLAAWTVWFMLGWTALAHAGPFAAAIGAIAGILAKGGIAAMLIKTAFGIALQVGASLIQRAIAKRQPQPGINGQLQVGGNNSFSFLVGTFATAGSLDYVGTWGRSGRTPNAYLTQVITVSDLMQGGISPRIFINNEQCEIDFTATPVEQGYPVLEYRRNGRDHMWVKVLDGTQTVADPFLLSKFGSDPDRPWTSDMIGAGSTIVVLTTLINRELLTSIPVGRYEPNPLPLYDPRKDTTVGGSGAHRWGNHATYEPTSNKAVIIYNVLRGIHDAAGNWIWGGKVPAARLPLASWFAAMNECDVPTVVADGVGGGPTLYEPQFSGGYEIKVADQEPADFIDEFLKGCNGQIAEIGGVYKMHVGAPGLPVMFVTDEDFVITDPQEYEPFRGLEQTFNGATASYPDPAAAWEMKDAPQRLFPDYEAEDDGRRLLANFQFNTVSSPTQVQRLMLSMVRDGRKVRRHRGTLPPVAFGLEPLDTISWTSQRNGYIGKLFTVSSKDEMTNVNQSVAVQEVDPSDYGWTPGTDKLPWVVGPINPRWPLPIPVTGWSVIASSIDDNTGTPRRPAIDLLCPGDNDDVRAIEIEVRNGDGILVFSGETPYGDVLDPGITKTFRLSGQWCLPNQPFTVRGRFLPFSGRALTWSAWLPITTLNIRLGLEDIYPDDLIPELQEFLDDAIDWIGPGVRALIDEARRLAVQVLNQDFANFQNVQQLRTELTSTHEDVTAKYTSAIVAATGPGSAIVQRLDLLEVNFSDMASASALQALTVIVTQQGNSIDALSQYIVNTEAAIGGTIADATTLLQSRVTNNEGAISAQATAITALSAGTVGGNVATANFRMTVSAGPSGYAARIGMEARAGGTGAYRSASLFLDVPSSTGQPTRIVMTAEHVVMTNGSVVRRPFAFIGGVLYIDELVVRWADIQTIVSNNFVATSANIGFAVINDGMIAAGAVTNSDNASASGSKPLGSSGWNAVGIQTTVASPSGNPVMHFSQGTVTSDVVGIGIGMRIVHVQTGTVLRQQTFTTSSGNMSMTFTPNLAMYALGTGTHTIRVEVSGPAGTAYTASLIAQCNKK